MTRKENIIAKDISIRDDPEVGCGSGGLVVVVGLGISQVSARALLVVLPPITETK